MRPSRLQEENKLTQAPIPTNGVSDPYHTGIGSAIQFHSYHSVFFQANAAQRTL